MRDFQKSPNCHPIQKCHLSSQCRLRWIPRKVSNKMSLQKLQMIFWNDLQESQNKIIFSNLYLLRQEIILTLGALEQNWLYQRIFCLLSVIQKIIRTIHCPKFKLRKALFLKAKGYIFSISRFNFIILNFIPFSRARWDNSVLYDDFYILWLKFF